MSDLPGDRAVVETTLRVRYAETDAMGVVYHSNYLIWFEVGRGEYSRQMGTDYRLWEERGLFLPVVEVSCRYLAPARYGDLVIVSTWVQVVRRRMVEFGYQASLQESGRVLVEGKTIHVCVNRAGQPAHIPADWQDMMSSRLEGERVAESVQ
jgi:acyl-CoA thioester hydrolase